MNQEYLFVYGTLRRDIESEMYHLLARHADFIGDATYQGRLYRIDYYPGVIPSENPAHQVKGDVYLLREHERLLSRLDEYEECGPRFAEPTEYVRERQEVVLCIGRKLIAWVYVYNRSTKGLPEITSGDFLSNRAEQDKISKCDKQHR